MRVPPFTRVLALAAGLLWGGPIAAAITLEDLVVLRQAGIEETVIRSYVEAEAATFTLTANDLIRLHQAGFSEPFLIFLAARPSPGAVGEVRPAETRVEADGTVVLQGGVAPVHRYFVGQTVDKQGRPVTVLTDDPAGRKPGGLVPKNTLQSPAWRHRNPAAEERGQREERDGDAPGERDPATEAEASRSAGEPDE